MRERENLIKEVCRELNLTYDELGKKIGYSVNTLNAAALREQPSKQITRAIEMYLKILELEREIKDFKLIKEILRR